MSDREEDESIDFALVPIASLVPHPSNYKIHTREQLDSLQASLLRFGQMKPCVVQRMEGTADYIILAGHGTTEAGNELVQNPKYARNKRVQSFVNQWKIIIAPTSWTPETAKAYLVADNETARKAINNDEKLALLLEEQINAGQDLLSLGYDQQEYEALLQKMGDEAIAQGEDLNGRGDYPLDKEEDDDLVPISDDDRKVELMYRLKFGRYEIPLTTEEFLSLEERVKLYGEETGSYYGFVRALLT